MNLCTGVDLIEIARVKDAIARHGTRFLERIYTPAELERYGKSVESLAGRFAAKEAIAKALGCGIGDVSWTEIEVLGDENRAPVLALHGKAAQRSEEMGLINWSLSISHSRSHAIAFVVAVG